MLTKLKSRWFPLPLILAVLILFWPALIHPSHILHPTFSQFSDTMVIHWPKARLMAESWQAGEGLPFWTPLILSGMPLAANQLAMLFYPPAWLFLLLPIEPIFNLLFIFHFLLGGFGVYFLLRRGYHRSAPAALIGGLTFALNGKWLAHAAGGHVSMVGAIAWMPWVLFGMTMLLKPGPGLVRHTKGPKKRLSYFNPVTPSLGWAVLVAVGLAMQVVTHTLLVIYTVYLLAAMLVWHLIFITNSNNDDSLPAAKKSAKVAVDQTDRDSSKSPLAPRLGEIKHLLPSLLLIPLLVGMLGAAQLLPLLELARFSNRSLSLSEAATYSVSPMQLLVGLLLPSAQGGHELVIYLGLIPLLLAPFGLSRRNRWTLFYGLLFILTVLFALGPSTPVHSLFYHFAPGFRWVRTPARIFFVSALTISVLVGFALDRLTHPPWSAATRRWLTRLAVGVGATALLVGLGLVLGFDQMNRATLGLSIFIPAGLTLILMQTHRFLPANLAIGLLGFSLFIDLASFDLGLMRFVSLEEALRPGRSSAAYLSEMAPSFNSEDKSIQSNPTGLFRVYSPSYSLPTQTAAAAHLHLADGVEPVHLAIYDQFMARAGGYGDASFSVTIPNFGEGPLDSALQDTAPNLKLLGLLNVRYLASAFPMEWPGLTLESEIDGTFIYRNEHALPRAWIVPKALPVDPNWLEQLEGLPDLSKVVLIDPPLVRDQRRVAEGAQPASPVRIHHYAANRIELETELAAPGWLVLSEIWYPGWQAMVNGSPQPVERVNGLLRGLYLDQPGPYEIKLRYRPRSVVWGRWISGAGVGLLVLSGMIRASRRSLP